MANSTYNFKAKAQEELSLSPLMEGREKLSTQDIDGKELTVVAFDLVSIDEKEFSVLNFAEYPDRFYSAGLIMTKLCKAWASDFDGDIEAASVALGESGGVGLRFTEKKTKDGKKSLVTLEVL
jgi:hypothetical protein